MSDVCDRNDVSFIPLLVAGGAKLNVPNTRCRILLLDELFDEYNALQEHFMITMTRIILQLMTCVALMR